MSEVPAEDTTLEAEDNIDAETEALDDISISDTGADDLEDEAGDSVGEFE